MGAGVAPFVPAQMLTDWPSTVMVPVAMVGQVPDTAGIVGPDPVVVIEPLLLPPLPLPPLLLDAPLLLPEPPLLDPELDPKPELEPPEPEEPE